MVLPRLKEWIGDLGIARRPADAGVAHRRVGGYLRAGQLRPLAGHRIRESDIGEAGLMVVGREEMLGALPLGQRRITLEDLADYPAQITERGDVFLLTEHGVRTRVDDAGDASCSRRCRDCGSRPIRSSWPGKPDPKRCGCVRIRWPS
ncbi:hypothetical protein SHKM778_05850 [Streptomyces sp. KM77-8]|uniref:Uncharacterized protein n=1 Tax=Streptomyces haneummycinicus TaxID=3074435 RepID=A0AAT9H9Z2_9ACTN